MQIHVDYSNNARVELTLREALDLAKALIRAVLWRKYPTDSTTMVRATASNPRGMRVPVTMNFVVKDEAPKTTYMNSDLTDSRYII